MFSQNRAKIYLIGGVLLIANQSVFAGDDLLQENNHWPQDSWQLSYEYDDFSEKIDRALLIYAPADFSKEEAILIRCMGPLTNLNFGYLEDKSNVQENGHYENDSASFAKHGFLYDDKRRLSFASNGFSDRSEVSVGGQVRHLTKWFPVDNDFKQQNKDRISMTWHTTIVYKETPSFPSERNTDLSRGIFKAVKEGLKSGKKVTFTLDMPNNIKKHFVLDSQRLTDFVPPEVLDFCFLKRTLRND